MIVRTRRAWELMARCLEVVWADPELLLLRLTGVVVVLPLGIAFLWLHEAARSGQGGHPAVGWGIAALAWISISFTAMFVNAATVANAVERLRGGAPRVEDAFRAAAASTLPLLGWTIVAATVGLLVRVVGGRRHRIVAGIVGATWSAATFLVVPVMVVERTGPIVALRRSAALLREAWGEQVLGRMGFGLPFCLLALPGVAVVLVWLLMQGAWPIGWMWLGAAYLLALAAVHATFSSVFAAALYLYAEGGEAPPPFASELLAGAITSR
jgi:hypothetical protein